MAEIIAESGMSAGAIYGHFDSKSAIIRAVATGVLIARLNDLEQLRHVEPMPEPSEMVRTIVRGFFEPTGWPAILLQVWGEAVTDPTLREVANDFFSRVRSTFAQYIARWQETEHGLGASEARAIGDAQAPLFLSAVHGFVVQDGLFASFDRDEYLAKTLPYLPK